MGDPFSVASSAISVVSLGLTVAQGLLQYYGAWKDYNQDLATTYATVEELTKTLTSIEANVGKLPLDPELLKRVQESLETCKNGVSMLEKKYTKIRGVVLPTGKREKIQHHVSRFLYPLKESTLAKLREIVGGLRDNLSLTINVLHLEVSGTSLGELRLLREESVATSTNVDTIQRGVSILSSDAAEGRANQTNREILAWISLLAPLDFWNKQQDVFVRCLADTGQWFLETKEFRDWDKGNWETLLCSGIPGAGKTVLSSIVINWLQTKYQQNESVGIAWIYCSYKEQASQRSKDLIASIWRQLNRSPISSAVRDLHTKHSNQRTSPSSQEIMSTLRSTISQLSRTFIVIDALDECPEENGNRAALLSDLRNLLPNISLMITSRTFVDVHFPEALQLDIEASEGDLRTYIDARILLEPKLQRHVEGHPDLRKSIQNAIINKACGMFLLAQLHVDSLSTKSSRKDVRTALETLPAELNTVYDEIMQRINNQNKDDAELARRVFMWVSRAFRPLSMEELRIALSFVPEDKALDEDSVPYEESIIAACAGLIVNDEGSQTVRLVHYTTQEYFAMNQARHFPSAHASITKSCLTYQSFSHSVKEEDRTRQRYYRYFSSEGSFLRYSISYWGKHIHAVSGDKELNHTVLNFLREAFQRCPIFYQRIAYLSATEGWRDLVVMSTQDALDVNMAIAAYFGLTSLVESLLNDGARMQVQGVQVLTVALENRHLEVAKLLLDNGAHIQSEQMSRAIWKNTEALKLLLRYHPPPIEPDIMREAVRHGTAKCLRVLLLKEKAHTYQGAVTGNNINTTCWPGSSNSLCLLDLYHTVQKGKWEIMEMLLKQRVDHDHSIGSFKLSSSLKSPLCISKNPEHIEIELLAEADIDVLAIEQTDESILDLAALAYTKRPDLLLSILGHKPSGESAPLIYPQPRVSILALAVQLYPAQPDLLPLALSYRTPAQIRNEQSGGALDLAASKYPSDTCALEILLDKGASDGWIILKHAIQKHNGKLLRILLQHRANVYANYPWTAQGEIDLSECHRYPKSSKESEIGLSFCHWFPNSLWMVIDLGFIGLLKIIIEEGIDITKTDETKSTILHYATGYDLGNVTKRDIITLLLASGVPINVRNLAGKTALDYAIMKGSLQLAEYLKEKGAIAGTEASEIETTSDSSPSAQHFPEVRKKNLSMLEFKYAGGYKR